MFRPFKTAADQLAKDAKQSPGWVPLTAVCYVAFELLLRDGTVRNVPLADHKEFLVAAATVLLYIIGDALDKAIWKRLEPSFVEEPRQKAEEALGVQRNDGLYRVSKSLAVAAEKYDGSWIQFKNELSKLLRSGILPCAIAAGILLLLGHFWWAAGALFGLGALLFGYLYLKGSHIVDLYFLSCAFSKDAERYLTQDFRRVRVFYWNGQLAASALRCENMDSHRAEEAG